MSTTYLKGTSGDTLQWQGNLTVDGTQVFTGGTSYEGDVTLGDTVLDTTIFKGRVTTGSVAGATLDLGATYLYNQLFELRSDVSNWTGMADNFTGAYLRFSTSTKTTAYNLRGMELNVASTAAVVNLSGLYSETQCKALAAGSTWTKVWGIEANLSLYDQTQTVAVTEGACLIGTIGLGSGYTAYTGIHGLIIETRDGSVGTRTLGSGIILRNKTPAEGTQTFTKGLQVVMACTTGISFEGAMTTGILIGACTTGVKVTGTLATVSSRAFSAVATVNIANYGDGYGLTESELTLTGTAAGAVAAMSSWINIPTGNNSGTGLVCAQTNGLWSEAGATNSGATFVFGMRAQCLASGAAPNESYPFSIVNQVNVTTALIQCNSADSDLGRVTDATPTDDNQLVPLYKDNTGVHYVKTYTYTP